MQFARDHDAALRKALAQHRGREIKHTGDMGISAGEPFCENNDLFGACVQLAARLCAHAQAGEILVSQAVVETIGRDAPQPTRRDAAMLKGFDMPTPIFSVDAT